MNKSKELKTTTDLVREILKASDKARNSDNYLYYAVCSTIGKRNGVNIESISMPRFLLNLTELGFPAFETVRRSRQKIQALHPELAPSVEVENQRSLNEEVFKKYAIR